ncbi:pilus assembly protein [Ovoidimarina sediminis]|uniref:pilus assembly protein n=1 Tax=Ovoidimarina sediminis TaxID=3079856 RepID=UPI00290D3BB5|nr:pilus assembly protein [Rhodophyticola sp. MJ-SS7]MDU8942120.1 pilus assembly protein [Rhodophyticola sp. MJ-SS7]
MVEAILWFPLMFFILMMVVDASFVFMNKARIERVVQDGQRWMAVGWIDDCDALEIWIEEAIEDYAPSAVASCSTTLNIATTGVAVPVTDIDISGGIGFLTGMMVNIESIHLSERGNS